MKLHTIFLFCVGCLQLTYAKHALIEEDEQKLLRCNFPQVLDIQYANYGGGSIFCRDNDVTSVVQNLCQNKNTCLVRAKDEKFGDSCFLLEEDLHIRYRCMDETTTSETTQTITISMKTIGQNVSIIEFGNWTNVLSGKSKLTGSTDKTVTIATLIAGCIFGLLLIGALTIAISRRFREMRDGSSSVLILQMSSLSQETINQRDDRENTGTEMNSKDGLSPTYDSVRRNNQSLTAGHSKNLYKHAHCSSDNYSQLNTTGLFKDPSYLSDGYSKAVALNAESAHYSGKNDKVYENENVSCNPNSSLCGTYVKNDNLITANKPGTSGKDKGDCDIHSTTENNSSEHRRKSNQYEDVDIITCSKTSHDKNVEDDELEVNGQSQRYMPMAFGENESRDRIESDYVPIMSPTTQTDIVDNTYHL